MTVSIDDDGLDENDPRRSGDSRMAVVTSAPRAHATGRGRFGQNAMPHLLHPPTVGPALWITTTSS